MPELGASLHVSPGAGRAGLFSVPFADLWASGGEHAHFYFPGTQACARHIADAQLTLRFSTPYSKDVSEEQLFSNPMLSSFVKQ